MPTIVPCIRSQRLFYRMHKNAMYNFMFQFCSTMADRDTYTLPYSQDPSVENTQSTEEDHFVSEVVISSSTLSDEDTMEIGSDDILIDLGSVEAVAMSESQCVEEKVSDDIHIIGDESTVVGVVSDSTMEWSADPNANQEPEDLSMKKKDIEDNPKEEVGMSDARIMGTGSGSNVLCRTERMGLGQGQSGGRKIVAGDGSRAEGNMVYFLCLIIKET